MGFVFLAASFAAAQLGHKATAYLLSVPLGIAAVATIENLTGLSLGFDTLLFPAQIAEFGSVHPGRPGANSIVIFLLLALAQLSSRRKKARSVELENLVPTATLYLGLLSLVLLLALAPARGTQLRVYISALPGSLDTIFLSAAFLFSRQGAGWVQLLTITRSQRPWLIALLPLTVLLPILPTLVERLGSQYHTAATPVWTEVLALDGAQIAIAHTNGEIIRWSHGCEQLYGWTSAEAVGHSKYALLQSRCEHAGSTAPPLAGAPTNWSWSRPAATAARPQQADEEVRRPQPRRRATHRFLGGPDHSGRRGRAGRVNDRNAREEGARGSITPPAPPSSARRPWRANASGIAPASPRGASRRGW